MNAGILTLCLCAAPQIASAQTMQGTDKGYVRGKGGAQAGSHDLSESGSFSLYEETATFTSTNKVKGGAMFDIGGAYRVWGHNLLAGLSYSHVASKSDGSLTGSIPDPIVFGRFRAVTKAFTGLKHSENAVHLDAIWMMPVPNKIDVAVFLGPTIFSVKQDTIPSLTITEPGPTITTSLAQASKTAVGFNIGVDAQYMLRKRYGVGAVARYAGGAVPLPGPAKKLTLV